MLRRRYRGVSRNRDRVKTDIFVLKVQVEFLFINIFQDIKYRQQCTVGQSPKGMMVFIYIGHYQGCRVLKCVSGLLQSVPRSAAECVQGYRVCAGCSFNILPCSTRLNQKIFY